MRFNSKLYLEQSTFEACKISVKCPECEKIGQESATFPANNIELSPEFAPFYDEDGRKIQLKQVALSYGCVYGHVFKLADSNFNTNQLNGQQEMSAMQEAI